MRICVQKSNYPHVKSLHNLTHVTKSELSPVQLDHYFPFDFPVRMQKKHAYLFTKWAGRLGKDHYRVIFNTLLDQVFYGRHFVGQFGRRRPCPLQTRHYETNGGK